MFGTTAFSAVVLFVFGAVLSEQGTGHFIKILQVSVKDVDCFPCFSVLK
jgi:hypothetical protein